MAGVHDPLPGESDPPAHEGTGFVAPRRLRGQGTVLEPSVHLVHYVYAWTTEGVHFVH